MVTLRAVREFYRQKGAVGLLALAARSAVPSPIDHAIRLLEDEALSARDYDLPPWERLQSYRYGFRSQSYIMYGFNETPKKDPRQYLNDINRYLKTPEINGQSSPLLINKLATYHVLRSIGAGDHLPQVYGFLRSGDFQPIEGCRTDIIDILQGERRIVVKPFIGANGQSVRICTFEAEEAGYHINGEPVSITELRDQLHELDNFLVTGFISQADYAKALYPDTPNTIRMVTMFDKQTQEAFCPAAMHRIGADRTGAIDNFQGGGLSAYINGDGTLGKAGLLDSGELRWYESHPDSGGQIKGTQIPGWKMIRDDVTAIASDLPETPYLGWDIIVTGEGEFRIVEINNHPGNQALQMHQPLLSADRVREFYEHHNVI